MKKILSLCILIFFLGFSVFADPKDYPPTAFQLAQIHHYVAKKAEIDHSLNLMFTSAEARTHLGKDGQKKHYLAEVEMLLKNYIEDPHTATRASWSKLIEILFPVLTCEGMKNTLSASFLEPGVKEIIVDAILAEQEAMKKGKVVVWRGSGSTSNRDQKKQVQTREIWEGLSCKCEVVPYYQSFSHGLFSGFIFDGHTHQRSSSYSEGSACTFTYFSASLYHKRAVSEGARGLLTRLQSSFPEYFEDHKERISSCLSIDSMRSGMDYLYKMVDYYTEKKGKESAEVMLIQGQYFDEVALIWNLLGGIRTPLSFHLYGVVMSQDELAQKSREAEETGDPNAMDAADQRGEFFPPEHAVYGRGELFHPKMVFPEEADIIPLYDFGTLSHDEDDDDDY